MKDVVRNGLVRIARSVPLEPQRPKQREKLIDVLEEHREKLYACVNVWQPNADDYTHERTVHARTPFLSQLRRKSA